MSIWLAGKHFVLHSNYQNNSCLRNAFNRLVQLVFGFNFEDWYQGGWWGVHYVPYTLFYNGEAVANVSVNLLDFWAEGTMRHCVQIGTVMTHPDYRGLGLARLLMERVMQQYAPTTDLVYLYANDTVVDFYPKYGFTAGAQQQAVRTPFVADRQAAGTHFASRRLQMAERAEQLLLAQAVMQSVPFANPAMRDNPDLVLFYCTSVLQQAVYQLPGLGCYAVAQQQGDTLLLYDIFAPHLVDISAVAQALAQPGTQRLALGFWPQQGAAAAGFCAQPLQQDDTTLFLYQHSPWRGCADQGMFPLLSQA